MMMMVIIKNEMINSSVNINSPDRIVLASQRRKTDRKKIFFSHIRINEKQSRTEDFLYWCMFENDECKKSEHISSYSMK